jgi:DNA-binding GntR family transcriptional regulator
MGMETKSKTKRRWSAAQTVYEDLKRQILTFQLLPGTALEEQQILRGLGFSRTPFREACMRLQEEGWLLGFSRRGFLVAPITLEDIANIYELRLILESACAQIAAARATEADIGRLGTMLQVEEGRDPTEVISANLVRANFEFHMYLAELTKNTRLISIVRNILEHVTRFDSMLPRYAPSTSWVRHRTIVEAITQGDPMKAGKSMQEHIEQARLRILNVFAGQSPKISLIPTESSPALGHPGPSGIRRSGRREKAARPSLARSEPHALVVR